MEGQVQGVMSVIWQDLVQDDGSGEPSGETVGTRGEVVPAPLELDVESSEGGLSEVGRETDTENGTAGQ